MSGEAAPAILGERARRTTVRDGARLLWRLLRELSRGDRRRLIVAAVVTVIGSATAGLFPVLVGRLVTHALGQHHVVLLDLAPGVGVVVGVVLAQQVLQVFRRQLVENVATGLDRDIRVRTYTHLLLSDLDRIRHGQVGGIYGRVNRGIEGSVKLLKLAGMDLIPALLVAVAALVAAFSLNPLIALVMSGVIPTGFGLVLWQVHNQAGVRVRVRDHKEEIDAQVVELLPALETVRAVGAQGFFTPLIAAACSRLRQTEFAHHRAMSLFDFAKAANEVLWLLAVLLLAITSAPTTPAGAGQALTFVVLFAAVLQPLRELHRIVDETAESASAASDLFDVLDTPIDQGFASSGMTELVPTLVSRANAPAIDVRDLRFAHTGMDSPVIDGFDLTVAAGERIGIVGASGCGKSTLLKLLRRFHHAYEGEIFLYGHDLRTFGHDALVHLVGYVAQDPRIFRGTVYDNIALGRVATAEAVVRAATRAHIHDEILAMPVGYDTLVGERGDTISGGQRQRICLARVLLSAPELLLLDEPTSALDATSERAVQRAIDAIEGMTMLIVAHRLSTLRSTDRILVFEKGAVVDSGHFDELATRDGIFRRLLRAQELTTV